jgi:hypothetical protein
MHNYIALHIGALVRWAFNGFNITFKEAIGDSKKFINSDEYYKYQRHTRYIGYITVLILIVLFGALKT